MPLFMFKSCLEILQRSNCKNQYRAHQAENIQQNVHNTIRDVCGSNQIQKH